MSSLPTQLLLELLALGACTGFLAGLLGIGGGMVLVPFLTAILHKQGVPGDQVVKMAIATAMSTILFTSISSLWAHHRHGAIRWPLVGGIAPGLVLGSLLAGAGFFALLKGSALAIFFGLFVGFVATQTLLGRKPQASRQMPGKAGQLAAGAGIGLLSGLVGAGGAFVSVPFMVRHNVPMHNAVATASALGFPIALASTAGYVISGWSMPATLPGTFGYLYLPALACIACASIFTAPLGARTAHRMDVQRLKRVFGVLLYALAGYMLWKGLRG